MTSVASSNIIKTPGSAESFQTYFGTMDKARVSQVDIDTEQPRCKPRKQYVRTPAEVKTPRAPKKEVSFKVLNLDDDYFKAAATYLDTTFTSNAEIIVNNIRKLKKVYASRVLDDAYFATITSVIDDYRSAIGSIDLAWRSTKLGSTLASSSNMVQYIHNIVHANKNLLGKYDIEWNNKKDFIGSFPIVPINDINACSYESLCPKEGETVETMTFGKSIACFLKNPVAVFELVAFGWFVLLQNIRLIENTEMPGDLRKKNIEKILLLSTTTIATQKPLMSVIKRKPKKKAVVAPKPQEEVQKVVEDEAPQFENAAAEEPEDEEQQDDEVYDEDTDAEETINY